MPIYWAEINYNLWITISFVPVSDDCLSLFVLLFYLHLRVNIVWFKNTWNGTDQINKLFLFNDCLKYEFWWMVTKNQEQIFQKPVYDQILKLKVLNNGHQNLKISKTVKKTKNRTRLYKFWLQTLLDIR